MNNCGLIHFRENLIDLETTLNQLIRGDGKWDHSQISNIYQNSINLLNEAAKHKLECHPENEEANSLKKRAEKIHQKITEQFLIQIIPLDALSNIFHLVGTNAPLSLVCHTWKDVKKDAISLQISTMLNNTKKINDSLDPKKHAEKKEKFEQLILNFRQRSNEGFSQAFSYKMAAKEFIDNVMMLLVDYNNKLSLKELEFIQTSIEDQVEFISEMINTLIKFHQIQEHHELIEFIYDLLSQVYLKTALEITSGIQDINKKATFLIELCDYLNKEKQFDKAFNKILEVVVGMDQNVYEQSRILKNILFRYPLDNQQYQQLLELAGQISDRYIRESTQLWLQKERAAQEKH